MTEGLELLADDFAIYDTLTADSTFASLMAAATGGPADNFVSGDTLPDEVIYPFVRFQHQTNADTQTANGVTVLNRAFYIITVNDRAETYEGIAPIYGRIHELLHRKQFVSSAYGTMLMCVRRQAIHQSEVIETVHYRRLGGVYWFHTQGD